MTSGSLQNYYRDEANDAVGEIFASHKINNNKTTRSKCFCYKTKIIGITSNDNNTLTTEVAVPLKY